MSQRCHYNTNDNLLSSRMSEIREIYTSLLNVSCEKSIKIDNLL